MATELLSPLLPQRRWGQSVAAAAPLLVLILVVAVFSRSRLTVSSQERVDRTLVAGAREKGVELTLVAGAREKGAVCLDGSPPGYHLRRGFGSGAHNWLIYLEGGAWYNSTQSCSERKRSSFGSSNFMGAVKFSGILSNDHLENPDFYDWNIVFVRYCDGASFAGDAEGGDLDGTKLFFRGLRIWEAVVDELMGKGMDIAHQDLSGERSMRSLINGEVHFQNVREALPNDCVQNKDPTECFFASELIKSISTPTFILNSNYDSWQIRNVLAPIGSYPGQTWSSCKADIRNCSSTQIDVLHGFRNKLVSELRVAEDNRNWGLFVDSCFTHCQTPFNISWYSPISPRLGDKTIAEAVGDWYFGRRQDVKLIDCEYPCNPTCSSVCLLLDSHWTAFRPPVFPNSTFF